MHSMLKQSLKPSIDQEFAFILLQNPSPFQGHIQNTAKQLRWSVLLQAVNTKSSLLDAWQRSEYASAFNMIYAGELFDITY